MFQKNSKIFDFAEHERQIDKLISDKFSHFLMSDAKWRKLFISLDSLLEKKQLVWKFVDEEGEGRQYFLPSIQSLEEHYINPDFSYGPRLYKEIEWIELPRTHYQQNIENIKKSLLSNSKLEIEETSSGLRIYGFK